MTILLITVSLRPVSAQAIEENPNVRECLDEIFSNIDMAKVPTGFLRDYAFTLVDFDQYDGSKLTDSNYVNNGTFEYILRSIRSSAVRQKPFGPVSSIMNRMRENNSNSIVCGIALYKYNYIRRDALEKGLIRYENEQVYDVYDESGNWINPYDEKFIFGFTSYSQISKSETVTLSFPEEFVFTNAEIRKLELDTGSGYKTITQGSTISVPIKKDEQELKLRVTLTNGKTLQCHSLMYSSDKYIAVKSLNIIEPPSPNDTIPFNFGDISAYASIFYAKNNIQNKILKPFIVVEGFDPVDIHNYLLKSGQRKNSNPYYDGYGFTNAGNVLFDELKDMSGLNNLAAEYDIIYIDWMNCEADIRKNAELLKSIIIWINNEKSFNGSKYSNAMMGQSMGGLISRYALRQMEINGLKHDVTTFISHDVPHLGASIPIGMLYGAHSLLSFLYGGVAGINLSKKVDGLDSKILLLKKYLYSDSAKQMLVNFVNESGQLDNTVHNSWQEEIGTLGFPVGDNDNGILNLAISNGGTWDYSSISKYAHISGYLNSDLINIVLHLTGLGIILGFNPHIPLTIDISPYFNYGAQVFNMKVEFRTNILFFIPLRIDLFKSSYFAPNSGLKYETFPGSTFSIPNLTDSSDGKINIFNYEYQINVAEKFSLIPNASALCIGNGNKSLSENDFIHAYWYDPPKPLVETPFHAILADSEASVHINPIRDMYNWILQQMKIKIDGPSMPVNGDIYTLENCSNPVTWSTGDNDVAIIDKSSGEITIKNPGVTTVNVQYTYNNTTVSRSKTIMVGLPDFYLQTTNSDFTYSVTAKCRTDGKAFKLFFDEGLIDYEWGVKKGSNPIQWTVQKDSVFVLGAPTTNQQFTVYMRILCNNGKKGPVYSIMVTTPYSFTFTPKFIVSNKNGELYICSNNLISQISTEPQRIVLNIKRSKVLEQKGIDPGLVRQIIINGEKERYWTEYPGGVSVSTGTSFYLLYEDEFLEYKNKLKPWGDTDIFLFSVCGQDGAGNDMQTSPVIMMYIEDFPKDYNEGIMMDMYFNNFVNK